MWVGLSGGDGAEVEFAAGQVDHGAEVAHVLESAGSGVCVQLVVAGLVTMIFRV